MSTSLESRPSVDDRRPHGGSEESVVLEVDEQAASAALGGRATTVLAVVLWSLAIAAGTVYGFWYETTPAATDAVPHRWPTDTTCVLSADRPTLLMFVHPRCPCSRASLNELAVLMTRCRGRADVQVLYFKPRSASEDWARTDLWESAARIRGVVPRVDVDGAEHRRFLARVSGEVFLFLPNGELAFHGGITAGRGHAGDNEGRIALESFLLHRRVSAGRTPVFGCELEATSQGQRKPFGMLRGPHNRAVLIKTETEP
jgi:hypothetical protein